VDDETCLLKDVMEDFGFFVPSLLELPLLVLWSLLDEQGDFFCLKVSGNVAASKNKMNMRFSI